jgi:hypothetical protein
VATTKKHTQGSNMPEKTPQTGRPNKQANHPEFITGYSIINGENLEAATKIAQDNPFIASIRIYEIVTK